MGKFLTKPGWGQPSRDSDVKMLSVALLSPHRAAGRAPAARSKERDQREPARAAPLRRPQSSPANHKWEKNHANRHYR